MTNDACWGKKNHYYTLHLYIVSQIIKKINICIFEPFKNLKQYKCDVIPVPFMVYNNMYNVWYSAQPAGYTTSVWVWQLQLYEWEI
jgi:hypothetical protein